MGIAQIILLAAGIASMKAALEKGDLDETTRQGVLAGPAVLADALASSDRPIVLAAIAAAPHVEGRAELLELLAVVAAGPDRRTAIPAARAAAQIARELVQSETTDDLSAGDLEAWRDRWAQVALDRARWIEVRVLAIDVATRLDRTRVAYAHDAVASGPNAGASTATHGAGLPITALTDPDPAVRRALLAAMPMPLPAPLRAAIAKVVVDDADPHVALGAAAALCADLAFDPPEPILDALGPAGMTRVQAIVLAPNAAPGALREAARCLAADKAAPSAAALRAIRGRWK